MDQPPWEPPLAGSSSEHLIGALDRMRWTFRWKVDGLDAAALNQRLGPSALTLGGLMKHLTAVEALRFTWDLDGSNPGEPWASLPGDAWPDWPFTSAAADSPQELYAAYDAAVARSRAVTETIVREDAWDRATARGEAHGLVVSVRRLLFDLVEEYGRHTGHADLLREAVDGRVGEDPPETWRPVN